MPTSPSSRPSGIFWIAALLCFGAVLAGGPAPATAQTQVEPGVRGGMTFMTYGGDPVVPVDGRRRGVTVGLFTTIDFAGPFALRPELNFTQKGTRFRTGADERPVRSVKTSYLELPVLAGFRPWRWGRVTPTLFAGPAFGVRVGPGDRAEKIDRRAEWSVVVGSGVDLRIDEGRIGALSLDARYQMGLRSVSYRRSAGPNLPAFDTGTFRNRGVVVTLGVSF